MDTTHAVSYLTGLLNKSLRVSIEDGRIFQGQLKCTDKEQNLILATTQEYRQPTKREIETSRAAHETSGKTTEFTVELKRRFIGLVVIPGQYITKIELQD